MAGTGALGDLGTHMIDAVRFIVGEIESVTAMLKTFVPERRTPDGGTAPVDVDDYAAFMAQFADGAVGTFVTTRNAIGFGDHLEVTLFGSEGTFRVNCERPDTIQVWKPVWNESGFEEQRVPESYRLNQLEHFLQYVAGDAEADDVPVLEDGYRNQLVLERIMESAQSGRSVQVIPS